MRPFEFKHESVAMIVLVGPEADLVHFVRLALSDICKSMPKPLALESYWLSKTGPSVSKTRHQKAVKKNEGFQPKWVKRHAKLKKNIRSDHIMKAKLLAAPSADLGLTPRESGALQIEWARRGCPNTFVADVSQNAGRVPWGISGEVPTLSCSGKIVSFDRSTPNTLKLVSAAEKLQLQGVDLSRVTIPKGMTELDMAKLAGNAMHVDIMALAMMLAMTMVNWNKYRLGSRMRTDKTDKHVPLKVFTWSSKKGLVLQRQKKHAKKVMKKKKATKK